MDNRRKSLTLVLGLAPLQSPGYGGGVLIRDYELTDEQIVTCFKLVPLEAANLPFEIGQKLAALREQIAKDGQQVGLARWVNGVECMLFFDNDRPCPRPEQLLRAYKNAFATRIFMSHTSDAKKARS